MKKILKNSKQLFIILIFSIALSLFITKDIKIFESDVLITYVGVLIGFSITIYTFGLSFLTQIFDTINSSTTIKEEKKKSTIDNLIMGYEELKEDVWTISICLIAIIVIVFIQGLDWNFVYEKYLNIGYWLPLKISFNTIIFLKIFFFIVATRAYIDLVQSLLTISTIIIQTTKNRGLKK